MTKLGFLGPSDLPQSRQGVGGFLNGLLLGKVWIPGENRSVPIVRGSFAPDPSQCNLKLSLQFLSTQVAPPTLRIDPIKTSPAFTANTKSSGTVEQNTCRWWQGQGVLGGGHESPRVERRVRKGRLMAAAGTRNCSKPDEGRGTLPSTGQGCPWPAT
jgi:hypothetical protein